MPKNVSLFKPAEDTTILNAVKDIEYLSKDGRPLWSKIAHELLPHYTHRQIRQRYMRILNPKLSNQQWSKEDDAILFQLAERHECSWSLISQHGFNGTRSDTQCRIRYFLLKDQEAGVAKKEKKNGEKVEKIAKPKKTSKKVKSTEINVKKQAKQKASPSSRTLPKKRRPKKHQQKEEQDSDDDGFVYYKDDDTDDSFEDEEHDNNDDDANDFVDDDDDDIEYKSNYKKKQRNNNDQDNKVTSALDLLLHTIENFTRKEEGKSKEEEEEAASPKELGMLLAAAAEEDDDNAPQTPQAAPTPLPIALVETTVAEDDDNDNIKNNVDKQKEEEEEAAAVTIAIVDENEEQELIQQQQAFKVQQIEDEAVAVNNVKKEVERVLESGNNEQSLSSASLSSTSPQAQAQPPKIGKAKAKISPNKKATKEKVSELPESMLFGVIKRPRSVNNNSSSSSNNNSNINNGGIINEAGYSSPKRLRIENVQNSANNSDVRRIGVNSSSAQEEMQYASSSVSSFFHKNDENCTVMLPSCNELQTRVSQVQHLFVKPIVVQCQADQSRNESFLMENLNNFSFVTPAKEAQQQKQEVPETQPKRQQAFLLNL